MRPKTTILLAVAGAGLAALLLSEGSSAAPTRRSAPCGVHGPKATHAVRQAIYTAYARRGYPRHEVAATVAAESGWYPGALACNKYGHGVAGGILQLIHHTLRVYHYDGTPAEFASLSGDDQLPYLVALISRMPRWKVPGDTRLSLAAPAFVGAPDSAVIYAVGTGAWTQNKGLRSADNGPITAGSIRGTII